jgi:hypothetical protein
MFCFMQAIDFGVLMHDSIVTSGWLTKQWPDRLDETHAGGFHPPILDDGAVSHKIALTPVCCSTFQFFVGINPNNETPI